MAKSTHCKVKQNIMQYLGNQKSHTGKFMVHTYESNKKINCTSQRKHPIISEMMILDGKQKNLMLYNWLPITYCPKYIQSLKWLRS